MARNQDIALGIDLGTTQSYMAYIPRHGQESFVRLLPCHPSRLERTPEKEGLRGKWFMPSEVLLNREKQSGFPKFELLIGQDIDSLPVNQYVPISRFKALLGERREGQRLPEYEVLTTDLNLESVYAAPEAIAGFMLWKMISLATDGEYITMDNIKDVTITVPALSSITQRKATRFAAHLAGFSKEVYVLEEPVAAFLHHYHRTDGNIFRGLHGPYVLVFDFGGGTLDTSIIDVESGQLPVVIERKSADLGGERIDELIVRRWSRRGPSNEHFDFGALSPAERHKLRKTARGVKEKLAWQNEASAEIALLDSDDSKGKQLPKRGLTQGTLASLLMKDQITSRFDNRQEVTGSVMELTKQLLDDLLEEAGISKKDIGAIILAGGSSRLQKIQSWLREWIGRSFPENKFIVDDVETSIAMGAAVHQYYRHDSDPNRKKIVQPTLPWDIILAHSVNRYGGFESVKLEENNRELPVERNGRRNPHFIENVQSDGGSTNIKLFLDSTRTEPIYEQELKIGRLGVSKLQIGYRVSEDGVIEDFYCAPGKGLLAPIYVRILWPGKVSREEELHEGGLATNELLKEYKKDTSSLERIRSEYGIKV